MFGDGRHRLLDDSMPAIRRARIGAVLALLGPHATDDEPIRGREEVVKAWLDGGETKEAIEQFYDATSITADDIAQIIAFAVSTAKRPYSAAVLCPICQGPSISFPRHQTPMA